MRTKIALVVLFVLFIFIPRPAAAGFESSLYFFWGDKYEKDGAVVLLAIQSISLLEENRTLQREIVDLLAPAIKNSLLKRGFVEKEVSDHSLLDAAPVVYAIEIFIAKDKRIAIFLKRNAQIKDRGIFGTEDILKLADDLVSRLLDKNKNF